MHNGDRYVCERVFVWLRVCAHEKNFFGWFTQCLWYDVLLSVRMYMNLLNLHRIMISFCSINFDQLKFQPSTRLFSISNVKMWELLNFRMDFFCRQQHFNTIKTLSHTFTDSISYWSWWHTQHKQKIQIEILLLPLYLPEIIVHRKISLKSIPTTTTTK